MERLGEVSEGRGRSDQPAFLRSFLILETLFYTFGAERNDEVNITGR